MTSIVASGLKKFYCSNRLSSRCLLLWKQWS